jgi:cyclic peptide transporter
MNLAKLLISYSEIPARTLVFLAFLAGLSSALVLITINSAAAVEVTTYRRLQLFLMFCAALASYAVSHHFVLRRTTSEVERTLHRLRFELSEQLRKCSLRSLEQLQRAEIVAAANKDTYTISQAAHPLVNAAQALLLVAVTCLYVGYLSLTALVAGIILTAICVPLHLAQVRRLHQAMKESTRIETKLFGIQADFLDGAKEMRLHQPRSVALGSRFCDESEAAAELKTEQRVRFASVFVFSQIGFYLLLATMVFMAPHLVGTNQQTIIATAMAVLFILGPISTVLSGLPILANANAAAENLQEISNRLKEAEESLEPVDPSNSNSFETIELENIVFEYEENGFQLGPIDLSIQRGELLFVTGGNGSGKSTLAKILCGLYPSTRGQILVDGKRVKSRKKSEYRKHFSCVFSDFHLFDELHGIDADEDQVESLLEKFGLVGKVEFKDGRFSTLALSTGQRKRLGLVVALLEERPALVLDEWAAEQDPEFREHFYRTLLPELKDQNKAVVVITHDDRYFDLPDQIMKLESGNLAKKGGTQ